MPTGMTKKKQKVINGMKAFNNIDTILQLQYHPLLIPIPFIFSTIGKFNNKWASGKVFFRLLPK
jgi:hypothetical protein